MTKTYIFPDGKKAVFEYDHNGVGKITLECMDELMSMIAEAPSIDIVRCKECKHWERLNYEAPKEGWCDDQMPYSDGRWVDAYDFCSYGERKESE